MRLWNSMKKTSWQTSIWVRLLNERTDGKTIPVGVLTHDKIKNLPIIRKKKSENGSFKRTWLDLFGLVDSDLIVQSSKPHLQYQQASCDSRRNLVTIQREKKIYFFSYVNFSIKCIRFFLFILCIYKIPSKFNQIMQLNKKHE